MMKTGMLILSNPNKYARLVPTLQKEIEDTLYIHLLPKKPQASLENAYYKFGFGPNFSPTMLKLYKNSICLSADVRVLLHGRQSTPSSKIMTTRPIDVVYFDQKFGSDEMNDFVRNVVGNTNKGVHTVLLDSEDGVEDTEEWNKLDVSGYDYVVLGGTFDRLHLGHKILLSEAVINCKKKLTVGVTDTEMIKTKILWELIEPCEKRMDRVKEFLRDIVPTLDVNVVPISDMYGPTKDDPTLQMILVSKETIKGGKMVNDIRVEHGLNPLVVHSVDLINSIKCDEMEEDKISSSNDRLRVLGLLLDKPLNKPNRPSLPYIIGFTGGIASGKSSICEKLKSKGAGVIDCDKIAHQLYVKGEPAYFEIIKSFGDKILSPTQEIDRKVLGSIVFNNKVKLDVLNGILWPKILKKSEELIEKLYQEQSKEVIILEAAVLFYAGWDKYCHEVWTSIVPEKEAMKRLINRNNLTEEEALRRIKSQPSNCEQVAKAHVVFSSLWRTEYTQKQVDKAWESLQKRLPSTR